MRRARGFVPTYGLDVLVVLAAAWAAVGTALRSDPGRPDGAWAAVEVVVIAGVVLALLLRGRFPFAAPATLWLVCTAISFLDGRLVPGQPAVFVAGLGAAVLLGNLPTPQARVGLAIVLTGAATVVYDEPGHDAGDFAFTPLVFLIGWLVGFALRERTEQTEAAEERARRAEQDRETAARIAVAEERARIARELHDVVAHAVSVMVLQVGAVRHRMPESDEANRRALGNVERAGRGALAEMRRLLGAMRSEEEQGSLGPQPGLADLPVLVEDLRGAGLTVSVHVDGEPSPLPTGLDLSAYRIVQEALTNVLKHANTQRADVEVHYGARELCLEVRDQGAGKPGPAGFGHGLVGIGERVKLYGGDLYAGPAPRGGWTLRARLPLDGDSA